MDDLISRQAAIDAVAEWFFDTTDLRQPKEVLCCLPSAKSETCEGCKHFGKWENEVEYGFLSPCTCCKRRVDDNYER